MAFSPSGTSAVLFLPDPIIRCRTIPTTVRCGNQAGVNSQFAVRKLWLFVYSRYCSLWRSKNSFGSSLAWLTTLSGYYCVALDPTLETNWSPCHTAKNSIRMWPLFETTGLGQRCCSPRSYKVTCYQFHFRAVISSQYVSVSPNASHKLPGNR